MRSDVGRPSQYDVLHELLQIGIQTSFEHVFLTLRDERVGVHGAYRICHANVLGNQRDQRKNHRPHADVQQPLDQDCGKCSTLKVLRNYLGRARGP